MHFKSQLNIAVAMSGGVDSSVAAALLAQQGHNVVGFTLKLWDAENENHARKVCCTTIMAKDAGRVCAMLNIPHYTIDMRSQFKTEVVDRFEREYLSGRTPNPCVHCNSKVKWGALLQRAERLGMQYIATGHYAQLIWNDGNYIELRRGKDQSKDQSYFLWEIPRESLNKTIFPLGELTKTEVRAIAAQLGLPVADKEESQEVCFVPNDDYRQWLLQRNEALQKGELSGDMITEDGKVIGKHSGFPLFTIGQRKGLGLGGGRKYYVTAINTQTKQIRLGDAEDLDSDEFRVGNVNMLTDELWRSDDIYEAKIRYKDPGFPAKITQDSNNTLLVKAEKKIRAVTPGQSAVIYLGDRVIAGGIIEA